MGTQKEKKNNDDRIKAISNTDPRKEVESTTIILIATFH